MPRSCIAFCLPECKFPEHFLGSQYALRRADIHYMDDYGVSPCDLAEDEEMMRALGMFKSIVMLENTAAFVIKVRPFVCFFNSSKGGLLLPLLAYNTLALLTIFRSPLYFQ